LNKGGITVGKGGGGRGGGKRVKLTRIDMMETLGKKRGGTGYWRRHEKGPNLHGSRVQKETAGKKRERAKSSVLSKNEKKEKMKALERICCHRFY